METTKSSFVIIVCAGIPGIPAAKVRVDDSAILDASDTIDGRIRCWKISLASDSYNKAVDLAIQKLCSQPDSNCSELRTALISPIELAVDFIFHDFEMAGSTDGMKKYGNREFLVADQRGYVHLLQIRPETFLLNAEREILDNHLKVNEVTSYLPLSSHSLSPIGLLHSPNETPFVFLGEKPRDADTDPAREPNLNQNAYAGSGRDSLSDDPFIEIISSADVSEEEDLLTGTNKEREAQSSDDERVIPIYKMVASILRTRISELNWTKEIRGYSSLCKALKKAFPKALEEERILRERLDHYVSIIICPWHPFYTSAEFKSVSGKDLNPLALGWDEFSEKLHHVIVREKERDDEYVEVRRFSWWDGQQLTFLIPKDRLTAADRYFTTGERFNRILHFYAYLLDDLEPDIHQPRETWMGFRLTYFNLEHEPLLRPDAEDESDLESNSDSDSDSEDYSEDGGEIVPAREVPEVVNPVGDCDIEEGAADCDGGDADSDVEEGDADSDSEEQELSEEWKNFFAKLTLIEGRKR